jgi:DNA-directed RNA polymerase specialized sigma24 family protein
VEAIARALAGLSFAEREALLATVRTEGQATNEEIAARLGIAPASVAVYRQRARERLRRALETPGAEKDHEEEGGRTWRRTNPVPIR